MSKLINVNCLHFIGCQSYTKILSNHASYQILATALLPFFQSILQYLTAVKDHVIKYSETAFSHSNVNYFWSIKTLPRSSKSCDCVTFRVLKYLLSTFPLYTPHCHMILSKQKWCVLVTGVSTESQKRPSVLQTKRAFLTTRSMTRINVGLALSCVKLLHSSLKTYMCNLKAWFINE